MCLGNIGGHRLRLTKAQREKVLQVFLNNPEEGTQLAMRLGLSPAYAYRLANERGLLPRQRKFWGKYREVSL